MDFPDLPAATRLPGVEEMWTGYIACGGEVTVLVITSLVLVLVAVFLFFLHRSNVLITFSRYVKTVITLLKFGVVSKHKHCH